MAVFTNDASGGIDDAVRIVVDGREVAIAESYEVALSVLEVPGSFALRVGHNGLLTTLIKRFPPNAQYTLYIGDVLQASGRLDGFSVPSDDGSTLEIKGRDALAPLHDAFVREEKSFANTSYIDLVATALAEAGIRDESNYDGAALIAFTNHVNRLKMSGVDVKAREPANVDEVVIEKGKGGLVYKTVVAKLSERWLDFVRTHLDRAGLFLWAAADGGFVLTQPNPYQPPTYALKLDAETPVDSRGFRGGVRRDTYENGVQPPRYSEVIIYSRVAAKKFGRGKVRGAFEDQEMIDLGIDRPLTMRDANVATTEQAEALARRKLAEGRRSTFRLQYTTHGHSAVSPSGARAVWAPDTTVALDDQEAGLQGLFYVEGVSHKCSEGNGRTTTLKLLRPDDVVFGKDE